MSLRKNMLVILLPLLGLVGFFAWAEWKRNMADVASFSNEAQMVHELHFLNDAVHELQKERGYSAGYISSLAVNFRQEILAQYAETDEKLAALVAEFSKSEMFPPEYVTDVVAQLDTLEDWRANIQNLNKTVPQLAGWYTSLIMKLLHQTEVLSLVAEKTRGQSLIEAKVFLGLAKESAGLERAMGATGLGEGVLLEPVHTRFISLGMAQRIYLESVQRILPDDMLVQKLYDSPQALKVQTMRQDLSETVHDRIFVKFTARDWFVASTEWIDTLRAVELALSEEAQSLAKQDASNISADVKKEFAILALVVFSVIMISVVSFESMVRRIKRLIAIMTSYKQGNFEEDTPFQKGKSELNIMSQAIHAFKEKTLEMQAENARIKEAEKAELNARHGKVVELMTEGLKALADADLSLRFDDPLHGDYDAIRSDYNSAVQRLADVLATLSSTVVSISGRAEEMKSAADDLSTRTKQEITTIQTTAESVSSLSETVEGDRKKIDDAKATASHARETATRSEEIVQAAISAMQKLSEGSTQIGTTVNVIEELSFQTNLLALNARVEAARAGESGRGFAVVASEVRELAKRSTQAAEDIKQLVNNSGVEVEQGVTLVNDAGRALQAMFKNIQTMDSTLNDVQESALRQSDELQDVNRSMNVLRNLSSANSEMVSENRNVSADLATMAQSLEQLVADFELPSENLGSKSDANLPDDHPESTTEQKVA